MSLNTDVLYQIVRQQKATFHMTIFSIAVRLIDVFLNQSPVLRVNPLENAFHRGYGGAVVSIDSEGFFRPEHLACGEPAAEAARVTEPLSSRQVRFAPEEFLGQELVRRNVYSAANDSFQRPVLDNRNTNATYVPNFAAGAHNPLGDITSRGLCNHPLD